MNQADGPLDQRQKRLIFRAWHRGTRETDLILGRFTDAHIRSLSGVELDDLETLLELPDPDIFAWVTGAADLPADASPLLRRLIAFHNETS